MAFGFTVNFNDPLASIHPQDNFVRQALNDALGAWSTYIAGVGAMVVNVSFQKLGAPIPGIPFELAGSAPSAYDTSGSSSTRVASNAAQIALSTGRQISSSDINITFNSDLLSTITSEASYSLVTVFEHELAHGFGISGTRGNYGPTQYSTYQSRFDSLMQVNSNGSEYFTGGAAQRVYGGLVPLTSRVSGSNNYHLGTTGTAADGSLFSDLMAPYLTSGASISPLDVAIMADLGIPLTAAGYVLENPYATLTATSRSVGGGSVSDPVISGTTQASELVTIYEGNTILGTTTADANGNWTFRAAGLADGAHALVATVPTAFGIASFGVPLLLDATSPVIAAYQQVLGRAADAGGLATFRAVLANGTSLSSVRATLANSTEGTNDINAAYTGVLGRAAQFADQTGWKAALAAGSSLAALRIILASSTEAAGTIVNAYLGALARAPAVADIVGWATNFAYGQNLPQLQAALGSSDEAAGAVNATYLAILGRGAAGSDTAGWTANLANGGNLANLRSQLGASGEAGAAITAAYQSVLGRAAQSSDVSGWQLNLKTGSSLSALRTTLAGSTEAGNAIAARYQTELGRAASATDIAGQEQSLARGASLSDVTNSLANSAEAKTSLTNIFQSVLGHAPDPVQVAAAQSELLSGFTMGQLQSQIGALAGGNASPIEIAQISTNVAITPETIAGSSGTRLVFGLPDNVAVVTAGPAQVQVSTGFGSDVVTVTGFNPASDFVQISSKSIGSFASLQQKASDSGSSVSINFVQGSEVVSNLLLPGVTKSQLTAGNFQFV